MAKTLKLTVVPLLLFLAAQTALAEEYRQPYLSVDVGVGAAFGFVGVGLEFIPVSQFSLFAGLSAMESFLGVAGGARVYPFGSRGTFSPFLHAFTGWAGLVMGDETLGSSYAGAGAGAEYRWSDEAAVRFGADYFHAIDDSFVMPFISYSQKF